MSDPTERMDGAQDSLVSEQPGNDAAASDRQSRDAMRRHGIDTRPTPRHAGPSVVSVVVPAFNAGDVIAEQLQALANQDYVGGFEVVVADNGSTDDTVDIVRGYRQRLPSLHVVSAAERRGAAHARNVGTRAASGEVIAYADADDRVRPDWLRQHVVALERHDFTAGRMDQHKLAATTAGARSRSFDWSKLPVNHDFLPWGFGGNLAVRRAAFEAAGGWDESYPAVNDLPFCWRVQLAGFPLAFVPAAVVDYRPRDTLRGLARQHRNFGVQNVRLYCGFRDYGARCEAPAIAARRWAKLVLRAPDLMRGPDRRGSWLRSGAFRLGLLQGSLRFRVLCL